jgi:hypothetical protein
LHEMAKTLKEIDEAYAEAKRVLEDADDGFALFLGYSGIGKSSTISKMLLKNIQQHGRSTNNNNKKTVSITFWKKKKKEEI